MDADLDAFRLEARDWLEANCPPSMRQPMTEDETVWGGRLREGDRSIDVYVHKLRAKLEAALPGWSFIHTHVGFGYRFTPERSHPLHTTSTSR